MYLLYPLVFTLVLSYSWASPVNHHHNQKANSHSAEAPSNTIDVATLSTSLGEYYEEITDQVMISFSRQLISDPANTHISRSLEQQVQFLHSNLIASIQPLVDSNLPWVISPPEKHSHAKKRSPGKDDDDDDDDEEDSDDDDDDNDDDEGPSSHQKKKKKEPIPIWSIPLKKDLQVLNRRISTQLGKIIHANQTAYNMILQAHTNSPHQITLSRSQPHPWEWLARKLMTIEQTLNTEFNKRIQDVVQCIMEDFLI